jgi:hypothetical protein
MGKYLLVFSLLVLVLPMSYSQSIQYSKSTFHIDNPEEARLVSNIHGHHHVVTFTYSKKPLIHVFDEHLRLLDSKQMDFIIRKDCDIRIVSFGDFYFVIMHVFRPSVYEIWKVDKEGNSVRFSNNFQPVIDTFLKHRFPDPQIMNVHGRLYALAQTYYDTLKSIRCMVVQLDTSFAQQKQVQALYPFDRETDYLQQVTLTGDALFVLKSAREETGNTLSIMKVDLLTGDVLTTSFDTRFQLNVNPGFTISVKDSSLLIYSTITQTDMNRRLQKSVFMSRLDRQLKEQTPIALLKHQFSQNTSTNFVYVEGEPSVWISIAGYRSTRGLPYRYTPSGMGPSIPGGSYNYIDQINFSGATGVRFTVVDKEFKPQGDSLVKNDKKIIEVQSSPFAQFSISNKSYLVLVQNFTTKRKGLVMLGSDDKNQLLVTPLTVFDRYDYILSQLQSFANYFIVPYSYKMEMGLMKVVVKEKPY